MSHLPLTERICACGKTFLGKGRAKWCSDRCRKDTLYGGTCGDCDAKTDGSNGVAAPVYCALCTRRRRYEERHWTPESIIASIQAFVAEHGRPPTADDWRSDAGGFPNTSTVQREFGGAWNAAIAAAGLSPLPTGHKLSDFPEDVRLAALALYREGKSSLGVERILGVNRKTVSEWTRRAGISRSREEAQRLRRKVAA